VLFQKVYYLFLAARFLTGAFGGILAGLVLAIVGDVIPWHPGPGDGLCDDGLLCRISHRCACRYFSGRNFNWKVPFFAVAILSVLAILMIFLKVPTMEGHLHGDYKRQSPLESTFGYIYEYNQLRALAFSVILMLGHFTIILLSRRLCS
jgi:DHA1 family inner membrane transport protein